MQRLSAMLCARALSALLGGALAVPALAVSSCPFPIAPPGARVEMIAPQVSANAMDTSISALTLSMPVAAVQAYYRALWTPLATPTRPGFIEKEAQGWQIISSLEGRCLTTVQIKAQGLGSYALVSVGRIQDSSQRAVAARTLQAPLPPGARVLSDTLQNDAIRQARTVVATSGAHVVTNAEFYASGLRNQGWITTLRRTVPTQRGPSEMLVLKRDTSEISVVIAPAQNGQVSIVANIVDRP
ncbi:MAG: hypothetical protein KA795_13585 [Burkholderiaceae bacterium]|nr:hypothetical protein [Burkholderiaceae bacterium]